MLRCILAILVLSTPGTSRDAPRTGAERARHVISVLGLKPGDVVADVGCGSGWLSSAVARAVGESGRVFAVEINPA